MTVAVSTAHLTGQMVMAGSPVHGTVRRAIGAARNVQAAEMRLLVDVEANPESTAHIAGETS
jgi:hypothetical protein